MPVAFLTDADRERLNCFPAQVAPEDLGAYFTLSDADGVVGELSKRAQL